jgi:hypothetical protein
MKFKDEVNTIIEKKIIDNMICIIQNGSDFEKELEDEIFNILNDLCKDDSELKHAIVNMRDCLLKIIIKAETIRKIMRKYIKENEKE